MPRRKPVDSLAGHAGAGDRRAALEALRDLLARHLETADRDVPALARQLREVMAELDSLPNPQEKSKVDELNKRRAARRAKAAG